MKQALTAAALGIMLATPAFADKPGADWMTIDQVATKLKTGGYGVNRRPKLTPDRRSILTPLLPPSRVLQ